jgi:hypothetical protein
MILSTCEILIFLIGIVSASDSWSADCTLGSGEYSLCNSLAFWHESKHPHQLGGRRRICWSECLVVGRRVVFSEVVCHIGRPRIPMDSKLVLMNAVLQPVEPHVNCLGTFLLNGVCENALCALIISLYWGTRSASVVRSMHASWALRKQAATFASATDASTFLIILLLM